MTFDASGHVLPPEGRWVTVFCVCQGKPVVILGRVLLAREGILGLRTEVPMEDLGACPATVLYEASGFSMHWRGRIREWLDPDRPLLVFEQPPRQGERREFIRAELTLGVHLESVPSVCSDDEAVLEWTREQPAMEDSWSFRPELIDLSGSGLRLEWSKGFRKGQSILVALMDVGDRETLVLNLPARVVRSKPLGGQGNFDLALHFLALSEDQRDRVHHLVFQARAAELGLTKF